MGCGTDGLGFAGGELWDALFARCTGSLPDILTVQGLSRSIPVGAVAE